VVKLPSVEDEVQRTRIMSKHRLDTASKRQRIGIPAREGAVCHESLESDIRYLGIE